MGIQCLFVFKFFGDMEEACIKRILLNLKFQATRFVQGVLNMGWKVHFNRLKRLNRDPYMTFYSNRHRGSPIMLKPEANDPKIPINRHLNSISPGGGSAQVQSNPDRQPQDGRWSEGEPHRVHHKSEMPGLG